MIWILGVLLIYASVCAGIYVGTYASRAKTKQINDEIIREGEKAEREFFALSFIMATLGKDLVIDQLSDRFDTLHNTVAAKEALLERRRNKRAR